MTGLQTDVLINTPGEGVQLDQEEIPALTVRTANTEYTITVLCGKTGDVQLVGGRYFPCKTRSKLVGASVGTSVLMDNAIYVGCNMEFLHEGRRVVTSPVCSIEINKAA